jgi:hypothetical protein
MKPRMTGDWWMAAPRPHLSDRLPDLAQDLGDWATPKRNQPNDHTIYQSADGRWQLWACVRNTEVGRLLVNWSADCITDSPWRLTGQLIRADRTAGESMVDWRGQEFLQSPFVVRHQGTYYMFYGGYDTGTDAHGRPTTDYGEQEKQICLMTSPDGVHWTRHRDARGHSRLFAGPGAVRDPCVMRHGDCWYIYYAGHHDADRDRSALYVRTSTDLLTWSDWSVAQYDPGWQFIPESPFVVERGGWFYLFRTHGAEPGTRVFRSADPLHFEADEGQAVCRFPSVIAPEVVVGQDGREFISNICLPERPDMPYGIRLRRLEWVPD